jgi:hypothetical protein
MVAGGILEKIKSYKDIRVYQTALEAAMIIFELTKRFPPEDDIRLSIRYVVLHDLFARILEKPGERGITEHTSSAN